MTNPRFPTMLRKMWSGREVQEWIDTNVTSTEPDCRLCDSYAYTPKSGAYCRIVYAPPCTNGDRYDPLPPVRLWRTT